MTNSELLAERKLAIFQLRQGKRIIEVAQSLEHSTSWVSKWHKRFKNGGWVGLKDLSGHQSAMATNCLNRYGKRFGKPD